MDVPLDVPDSPWTCPRTCHARTSSRPENNFGNGWFACMLLGCFSFATPNKKSRPGWEKGTRRGGWEDGGEVGSMGRGKEGSRGGAGGAGGWGSGGRCLLEYANGETIRGRARNATTPTPTPTPTPQHRRQHQLPQRQQPQGQEQRQQSQR